MQRTLTAYLLATGFVLLAIRSMGQGANFLGDRSLYVEGLGHSLTFVSINYEKVIYEMDKFYFTTSIGYGDYSFIYSRLYPLAVGYNIPITVNLIVGKKNHHLEFGQGMSLNRLRVVEDDNRGFLRTVFSIHAGYRYQKPDGRILIQAGFTLSQPAIYFYDEREDTFLADLYFLYHLVGGSVGFTFQNRKGENLR